MTDASSFIWPNGVKAAVSLTFDDGMASHVENAIPMMNDLGIVGTFYLPMGDDGPFYRLQEQWREAARAGHEIGNHSMTHPCSRTLWPSPQGQSLDDLTLEDIEAQIVEAKRRLEEGLPEQREHTFAYPCGETHVGRGRTRASYVPIVATHYTVGRWLGDGVSSNDPNGVDLACVWSCMPEGESGERMIRLAEKAVRAGKWLVYTFHGIGGGHINTDLDAFRQVLDYLLSNREHIWTDTMINVGRWIDDHR